MSRTSGHTTPHRVRAIRPADPRAARARWTGTTAPTGDDTGHEAALDQQSSTTSEHLLYVDDVLRITCTVMPGPSVIRLAGEIDSSNSADVALTLAHAWRIDDELIMDLGEVRFIDIAGIRMLRAFTQAGPVHVRDIPHQMRRLMGLMGLFSLN